MSAFIAVPFSTFAVPAAEEVAFEGALDVGIIEVGVGVTCGKSEGWPMVFGGCPNWPSALVSVEVEVVLA